MPISSEAEAVVFILRTLKAFVSELFPAAELDPDLP